MDDAIIRYMRNKYNHVIGILTAEQVKKDHRLRPARRRREHDGRQEEMPLPACRQSAG